MAKQGADSAKGRSAAAKRKAMDTSKAQKKAAKKEEAEAPGAEEPQVPEKRRSHTSYLPETFMAVTRWMENTQIRYKPHAKRFGSKSYVRYERYSKAKTVGQSLAKGSLPADWCWDLERNFIKVLGPVRDEPLDPTSVQDMGGLSDVDREVGRWFKREAARMMGMDLKTLSQDKSWGETILLRIKRSVAERKAKAALDSAAAEGQKVADEEVLTVLRHWGFRQNTTRENVMPEGVTFVHSDTLGMIPSRDGRAISSRECLDYPNVVRLFCQWLRDRLPEDVKDFGFTSINVNKNYAGRLHRDSNNVGPSLITAFGGFKGGQLNYYSDDNRLLPLEDLPVDRRVTVDLSSSLVIFDGKRGHSVKPFEGERYSLVYFTCSRYPKADAELKRNMLSRGIMWPTKASAVLASKALKPPAGYKGTEKASTDGKLLSWRIARDGETARRGTKRGAAPALKKAKKAKKVSQ